MLAIKTRHVTKFKKMQGIATILGKYKQQDDE